LGAARETKRLDTSADPNDKIVADNKAALSALFKEVRSDQTPEIIARVVDDIDIIVEKTKFRGWQDTIQGDREMKQALRKTLLRYQLHKDAELFEKAYDYISAHY